MSIVRRNPVRGATSIAAGAAALYRNSPFLQDMGKRLLKKAFNKWRGSGRRSGYVASTPDRRFGKRKGSSSSGVRKKRKVTNRTQTSASLAGMSTYANHKFKGHKLGKNLKLLMPVQTVQFFNSANNQNATGLQNYVSFDVMNLTHIQDVMKICQNQRLLTSAQAANNLSLADDRVFLVSTAHEITFKNNALNGGIFYIYDLVVKRDGQYNPTNAITNGGNPIGAIQGVDNSNIANVQALNSQMPGFKPQESDLFTKYWAVTKCTKLQLAGGQTHIHKVFTKYNKILPSLVSASPCTYFRGFGTGVLVVFYGDPVVGSGGGVANGAIDMTYVESIKMRFRILPIPQKHIEQINSITFNGNEVFESEELGQVFVTGVGVSPTAGRA